MDEQIYTTKHLLITSQTDLTNSYRCVVESNRYSNSIPVLQSYPETQSISQQSDTIQSETKISETSPTVPAPSLSISSISSESSISSCSSYDSVDFMTLLTKMSETDEDMALAGKGLKKLHVITESLQGELLKVTQIDGYKDFVIKRTEKRLHKDKIAIEDDTNFCVDEDIVKEGLILKHLTVDNVSMNEYIVNYIDFFETQENYYLVMEYIESETNLAQFMQQAHELIQLRKLKLKHYQKVTKRLFFQLILTIQWIHREMNCAHLDLETTNIMLKDCDFIEKRGKYVINPKISIKLGDFGCAEIFDQKNGFICSKTHLNLARTLYFAPKVFAEELYDARSSDMWSLGIILHDLMIGKPLWDAEDVWNQQYDFSDSKSDTHLQPKNNGFWAVRNGKLKRYFGMNGLIRFVSPAFLDLLNKLLTIEESARPNATTILNHKWFKNCIKKYDPMIGEESTPQEQQSLEQQEKMMNFPFYRL